MRDRGNGDAQLAGIGLQCGGDVCGITVERGLVLLARNPAAGQHGIDVGLEGSRLGDVALHQPLHLVEVRERLLGLRHDGAGVGELLLGLGAQGLVVHEQVVGRVELAFAVGALRLELDAAVAKPLLAVGDLLLALVKLLLAVGDLLLALVKPLLAVGDLRLRRVVQRVVARVGKLVAELSDALHDGR